MMDTDLFCRFCATKLYDEMYVLVLLIGTHTARVAPLKQVMELSIQAYLHVVYLCELALQFG